MAIILVTVIAPDSSAYAEPESAETAPQVSDAQEFSHSSENATQVVRDNYRITKKPSAPAVGKPDAGTAKAIAYDLVRARGWGENQYNCLVALWTRESNWNTFAMNPSSGAYGIPQSLPGNKMASAGADWATNPETQIRWGLGYISGRYGSPCGAWEHSEKHNWY